MFRQLEGFGSYGFPESHATSFASLVYASAWVECFYPDVFASALLNSQPMGFYSPAQIIQDAREHNVVVRLIDMNHSDWDNRLEKQSGDYRVLRLGFRQVLYFRQDDVDALIQGRKTLYRSINATRDAGLSQAVVELLAGADAFNSIGFDRREALWQASPQDKPVALFQGQAAPDEAHENVTLSKLTTSERLVQDFEATSLSLRPHALSFLRSKLQTLSILSNRETKQQHNGAYVRVAGIVTVRQRPATAKGVMFMTIQDKTGYGNLVIFKNIFEEYRKVILKAQLIMVTEKLQIEGEVFHGIMETCQDFSKMLRKPTPSKKRISQVQSLDFADETFTPSTVNLPSQPREKSNEGVFDKSRNFQ